MSADRGDVSKSSAEIFFRKVKFWKGEEGEEAPPVFVGTLFLFYSFIGARSISWGKWR